MDDSLIATHPDPLYEVIIALVFLGFMGYVVVRQWPGSLPAWLLVCVALIVVLAIRVTGFLYEDMPPDYVRELLSDIAFSLGASVLSLTLPILAFRRSRSRPLRHN